MYEVVFSQSAAGSMRMAKSSGLLEGASNQVISLHQALEAGADADKLLRAAAGGAALRIWWSDAPYEARGPTEKFCGEQKNSLPDRPHGLPGGSFYFCAIKMPCRRPAGG